MSLWRKFTRDIQETWDKIKIRNSCADSIAAYRKLVTFPNIYKMFKRIADAIDIT